MTSARLLLVIALLAACEWNAKPSPREVRVMAARRLTQRYAQSPLAPWNVRARAAGRDCDVLLVDTPMIMGDSMIEALHYGGGVYSVDGGGVEQFCRSQAFRGVAYKDSTDRVWTYGNLTAEEAQTLKRCD